MARGARAASRGEVVALPLSDGGPGLIDALQPVADRIEQVRVSGPLKGKVDARIMWIGSRAIIESADACGLHLVHEDERDPWNSHTRGVGELISQAAGKAMEIVVGLGGSATVDGGAGLASALGWRLLDANGKRIAPIPAELQRIARIERPVQSISAITTVLADVTTPLVGPDGAARVFGPQKGVAAVEIDRLDRGLRIFADVIARDVGRSVHDIEGGGAAGGLGAALVAFLGGRLRKGSEWVLDALGFDTLLARASVVITGEGSYDAQSALGKITGVLVERARATGIPVVLIAGRVEGALPPHVHAAEHNLHRLSIDDLEQAANSEIARLLHP
jgi:glycerate 2-kinase